MAAGFDDGDGCDMGGVVEGKAARTLVVFHHIAEVVLPAVMCLPDAHRIVGEVDVAVVALRGC